VSTLAGDGESGYRDGAVGQARFHRPGALALLPDERVLVADMGNHRIRMIDAALQQVSTVTGVGEGPGYANGAAAHAQFRTLAGFAVLDDGSVLVADDGNNAIRMLSKDLSTVTTVAGNGENYPALDDFALAAQFDGPSSLALLPDGRVLFTDKENNRIRVLHKIPDERESDSESEETNLFRYESLGYVNTVAGGLTSLLGGYNDGEATQALFDWPSNLLVLPDGRVLVVDQNEARPHNTRIRVLSADLLQVSTLTNVNGLLRNDGDHFNALALLADGRVLISAGNRIHVLEGLMSLGNKPPDQAAVKRALKTKAGGGASSSSGSSSGPMQKRSRSGASSSAAAMAYSSDIEGEEQPGGSAAEAEPLVLYPSFGRLKF